MIEKLYPETTWRQFYWIDDAIKHGYWDQDTYKEWGQVERDLNNLFPNNRARNREFIHYLKEGACLFILRYRQEIAGGFAGQHKRYCEDHEKARESAINLYDALNQSPQLIPKQSGVNDDWIKKLDLLILNLESTKHLAQIIKPGRGAGNRSQAFKALCNTYSYLLNHFYPDPSKDPKPKIKDSESLVASFFFASGYTPNHDFKNRRYADDPLRSLRDAKSKLKDSDYLTAERIKPMLGLVQINEKES